MRSLSGSISSIFSAQYTLNIVSQAEMANKITKTRFFRF